ncbi:uncharacterized protein LOC127837453 [Dreissena polymorpha]|nr:uncharacterized protein LOC127837453 [Dreissena polymorpha]
MIVNAMYNCSGNCQHKICPERGFLTDSCVCFCPSPKNETWITCPGESCQTPVIDTIVYTVYNEDLTDTYVEEELSGIEFPNGSVLRVEDNRCSSNVDRFRNYTCKDGRWLSSLNECKKEVCRLPFELEPNLTLFDLREGTYISDTTQGDIKNGSSLEFHCKSVGETYYEPNRRVFECDTGSWVVKLKQGEE